jgi:hypothetical protein
MKKPSLPAATYARLMNAEPWIAYSAAASLAPLRRPKAAELEAARIASVGSQLVGALVKELEAWPGRPLASHKSAEQLFHRLALAAQLGLRKGDPGADAIAAAVMAHRSEEGPFGLRVNFGAAEGGAGEEVWAWALCDAPVVLRALARMGYADNADLRAALAHLVSLEQDIGWSCAVSKNLGKFRGPGKKSECCPYATLVMLELLLELDDYGGGPEARAAAECLLGLWERSLETHPYIFYMGKDFRKLKAPLVWYDLLHVLEALSKVEAIRDDHRLAEMLDLLQSKAGPELLFTPESVYAAWKDYDFGQKKQASLYLSSLALGVLARTGRLAL